MRHFPCLVVLILCLSAAAAQDRADSPDSYAKRAEAAAPPPLDLLERGMVVSLRDRNAARTEWFAARLRALGHPSPLVRPASPKPAGAAWVRGGLEALAFIARGKPKSSPEQFMAEYCRALVINGDTLDKASSAAYRRAVRDYFARVALLSGGGNKVSLRVTTPAARRETERILAALGWKARGTNGGVAVEALSKESGAQDTASALGIDVVAMKETLEAGKPFSFEVPVEWAPVVLGESAWREAFYPNANPAGGLAEVLASDPRLAMLYAGLSAMDSKTAAALVRAVGLEPLASKFSTLLCRYSAALAIDGNGVVVPGGAAAARSWATLTGANPAAPAEFLPNLLGRDSGSMLAWFAALAQLDLPHQRFFTANPRRLARFYDLFRESPEMEQGAGKLMREMAFSEMLREVPLDAGGGVAFPGSPQVWMAAEGSASTAASGKRVRQLDAVDAPERGDDILVRLCRKRFNTKMERRSELDNFLAVVRVQAHRREPLDEASALLLAENSARYPGLYPYFAVFTALERADFEALFRWAESLRAAGYGRLGQNAIAGQWHALMELICLARQAGRIDDGAATELFRSLLSGFEKARSPAEFAAASLDTVRRLLARAGAPADPDEGLRDVLLGASEERRAAFDRVLDVQGIPRLCPLFEIERAAREGRPDLMAAPLEGLPDVDAPANLTCDGKQKRALKSSDPEPLARLAAAMRARAAKKSLKPEERAKLATRVLAALAPQLRLALTGAVYAYFLRPDDLVVNDPLLVRKHQFVLLESGDYLLFPAASLNGSSDKCGRFATGGFADFARIAGQLAVAGVRNLDPNSADVAASQIGAVRMAQYAGLRDEDLRLFSLRVDAAREWVIAAAVEPPLRSALLDSAAGLLSLARRRALAAALDERDWPGVWASLTLSDLYSLGRKYTERFPDDPLRSPVTLALKGAAASGGDDRLEQLGGLGYSCVHPHLVEQPPYEDFERYMMPSRTADRVGEFKLYLADAVARQGLPASALGGLVEPALKDTIRRMHMADPRDWRSALAAFSSVGARNLKEVLEPQ